MKIGTFTFFVTSEGPNKTKIRSNIVFDIFEEEHQYAAIPLLNEPELRLAHIPAVLFFRIEKGRPVSSQAEREGYFDLLYSIVQKLKELKLIS